MIKNLLQYAFVVGLLVFVGGEARAQVIAGTVFEDVNYGGGAGRTYAVANAAAVSSGFGTGTIGRPGARVELYDASGALAATTTTDASGQYSFGGLTVGAGYTVRVVNATVTSARATGAGALLPVQTFRTNAGTADAQRVGGENPAATDAAANTGSVVVTGSTATNNIALSFVGAPSGGDATLFLDNVEVLQGGTPLGTNPIGNPGFEAPVLTTAPFYIYNVPTTGTQNWTLAGGAGIQANGSAFGAPSTGNGNQAGFIQSAGGGTGTTSQSITLPLGTYQVRFSAANRQYGVQQTINVVINGFTVLANVQASSGGYASFVTQAFTVGTASGGAQNLSSLAAQSVAPITAASGTVANIDFGFSFDVVTNTNDAGQGSVRQFILNSNALANTNLAQAGQVAGRETSIFMIPNGVGGAGAPAGLQRTPAVASGLNASSGANTWARLQVLTVLPDIIAASTTLDATTQTTNIQDSNPGQLGTGGTVGTEARAMAKIDRPEVEVYCLNTIANVFRATAANTIIRGFAVHGGGTAAVMLSSAPDFLVEKSLVGITAFSIADPNAGLPNTTSGLNIFVDGTSRGTLRNNVIAFANSSGLFYSGSAGSGLLSVVGNEFVQNGYRTAGGDNITAGGIGAAAGSTGPMRIWANIIRSANSDGIQFEIGSMSTNSVRNNTFFDNGNGGLTIARSQLEGAAILYLQRTGTYSATTNDSIALNVINQSQASGVVIGYGQRGVIVTRNQIFFNGTPFNSPTGSNLGLDLIPQSSFYVGSSNTVGARDYGNGDGVTPNNGPASLSLAYGNAGMNYPIIEYARVPAAASPTVNVGGHVGSAAGQAAFAGAIIDFYVADNGPANNNGPVLAGDGRKVAHGEGRSYVGSLTADAGGNFAGTITVPLNTAPNTGPAASGLLTATATLVPTAAAPGAPNYGTSEFSPNVPVIISADAYATISGQAGGVTAGGTGSFTVVFGNQSTTGPVQADGVTALVQLPPGLAGVTATGGGTYDIVTGVITYAGYTGAGSLPSGASFGSTITYPHPVSGAISATASINTTTNEGTQLANNSATATNQTNLRYDVATSLTGPATAVAGAQVSYNVTTTNLGTTTYPSPAPQVVQTVSIPAGASNVYVTGGGLVTGSQAAGYTVTFPTLPTLAPTQSLTNTVSFTAPSAGFQVTGNVSTTPADGVSGNNASTATTSVGASGGLPANVYVSISPSASTVAAGAAVSFVVQQGNNGPNAASGVQTTVLLPPGLPTSGATAPTLAGYTLSGSTATTATYTSGSLTATYNATSGLFTLPAAGSQASGAVGAAANSYTLGYTAPVSGVFTATATVSTTTPDPVLGDNVASAQVTVNPGVADLAVALTGPTIETSGAPLTYTLTTTNNGPGVAQAVVQTVSIPAGLGLSGPNGVLINGAQSTSVSGNVATYGVGAAAVTYNSLTGIVLFPGASQPSLNVGSIISSTITYVAPANGNTVLTNTAAVQSSSADPVLANNTARVVAPLQPVADVQVSITAPGFLTTNASGGNPVLFGVTTVNNGPSIAPGVATTVELPTQLPITGSGPEVVRINGQLPSSVSGGVATYNFPDGTLATYDSNTSFSSTTPGLVTFSAQTNLTPGGSGIEATIGFVLPTGYIGQLVATARTKVTGILDTDQSNNVAQAQPILGTAVSSNDVSTTVSASAGTLTAGQPLTLTVTSNPGTGATGVLQALQLPPGLTSNGGTVTVSGGPGGTVVTGGALSPNYDNASGLLTFPAILNLPSTTSYAVVISRAPGQGPLVATASITANELDSAPANNANSIAVAITPSAALSLAITGPATAPAGTVVSYLLAATNNGPTNATGVTQSLTLPAGVTAYSLNGGPLVAVAGPGPTVISVPVPATIVAGLVNSVSSTLTFLAPGGVGTSFSVSGSLAATGPGGTTTATGSQATAIISPGPIAYNVVNSLRAPAANTAQQSLLLDPLQAQAQTGAALDASAPFVILTLPLAGQGVLSLGGTPVVVGQTLTAVQAGQLRFLPASGFVGNAPFTYQALDNRGLVSNVARYLIPVAADNAAVYANTPVGGGTNPYANGGVIAYVIDPNGALYTSTGTLYQTSGTTSGQLVPGSVSNGLFTSGTNALLTPTSGAGSSPAPSGNPTNVLPAGTALNPSTGQITVTDRTLLVAGTFTVNITTTDVFGGVTTQPVTFRIGINPLPVELTAFTAEARGRAARLSWSTASEKNSARFEIERSVDGATFRKIGQVAAQGNSTAAINYGYSDQEAAQAGLLVYYRLRQVDLDGTDSYSPVRTVRFAPGTTALEIYPNPAQASTTLDLTSLPAGTYTMTLTDATGRRVRELRYEGGLAQALDLRELASGSYLVRLTGTAADGTAVNFSRRLSKEY